jgi:hypothetical protein
MTTQGQRRIIATGPDKSGLNFFQSYSLSAAAACVAETATYPFDMIKTRLQVSVVSPTINNTTQISTEVFPRHRAKRLLAEQKM